MTEFDPITYGVKVDMKRTAAADAIAHRSSLTAPDLLGGLATAPTVPTFADSAVVEGTLTATPYYAAYAIRNGMGITMASAIATVTPTATHSVRITIPSGVWRVTDTDAVYEFFMSTDAAPKRVVSATAAQLAAGNGSTTGCHCTTEGTLLTNGTAPTWAIDIGVVGSTAQTTAAIFAQSTAYKHSTVTAVDCSNYQVADIYVDATITAMTTTAPVLTLLPIFLNDKQATNYHSSTVQTMSIAGAATQTFRQKFSITTNANAMKILVSTIANVTVNRIDITPVV